MTKWMERKAQQGMLKRAMEAGWTASTCVGMVFGPLAAALEMGNAARSDVNQLIDDWLQAWREVRELSDRNLHRNRPHYDVRPNAVLSPILLKFEREMSELRRTADSDGPRTTAALKEIYTETIDDLRVFNEWAKAVGPDIDFDATKYEETAVKKAQRHWEPTVKQLRKMMGP